jgi:hypothetical protein
MNKTYIPAQIKGGNKMKQEFEMTEEELQAIYDISRNKEPVIFVGVWTGLDSQERANKLWQCMGDKYGFVWDSAEPSAKGDRFFLATPKEKVIPLTAEELAIKEYTDGGLKKIIEQLEFCDYKNEHGSDLKLNVAFIALKKIANDQLK